MLIPILFIGVVICAIIWWVNKSTNESSVSIAIKKVADVNKDGKIDAKDAVAALTKVADVNNDGKVDLQDAIVVGKKAVEEGKKVVKKVKTVTTKKKKNS